MRIGEVARRAGVSVRMLRHYDQVGLVSPSARSGSGYREYDASDLRRLFQVEALRTLGLSLAQVIDALDAPGFDAAEVVQGLRREAEARLARERALLSRLQEIEASAPADWGDVLDAIALLAALRSGAAGERQAAALGSGSGPVQFVTPLVDAYLAEDDPHVAGALRWAIVRAGEPAVASLVERAQDPEGAVRLRVMRALSGLSGAAATRALAQGLSDSDPRVARRAAVACGAPGRFATPPPGLTARLVEMIVEGDNDLEAAETLGSLATRSPDARHEVLRALTMALEGSDATTPQARVRLAQALGELPLEAALAQLEALARDPDPAVARVARYLVDRAGAVAPGGAQRR